MNKFLFFFRGVTSITTAEDQNLWSAWIKNLKEVGSFIDGAPLIRDGVIIINNEQEAKPFQFNPADNASGFIIIQAKNLEEAITLSKNCPIFKANGNITIRPIIEQY